jgi:hypothetical protein
VPETLGDSKEFDVQKPTFVFAQRQNVLSEPAAPHFESALRVTDRDSYKQSYQYRKNLADDTAMKRSKSGDFFMMNHARPDCNFRAFRDRGAKFGLFLDGSSPIGIGVEHKFATRRCASRAYSLAASLIGRLSHDPKFFPPAKQPFKRQAHAIRAAVIHDNDLVREASTPKMLPNRTQVGRQSHRFVVRRNQYGKLNAKPSAFLLSFNASQLRQHMPARLTPRLIKANPYYFKKNRTPHSWEVRIAAAIRSLISRKH